MTVLWSAFTPEIRPEVPGCPTEAIENAVRKAVIDFCNQTLIWREELAAIDTVVGQDVYTLTPPAQGRVVLPIHVAYDEITMLEKSEEEQDYVDDGWRISTNSKPRFYHCPKPDQIRFSRKSDSVITGGIVVKAAIKPTNTATGVDDIIFDDWLYQIKDGALATLMSMPKQVWYDPNQSIIHDRKFNAAIQRGKSRAKRGHTRKTGRVRFRKYL